MTTFRLLLLFFESSNNIFFYLFLKIGNKYSSIFDAVTRKSWVCYRLNASPSKYLLVFKMSWRCFEDVKTKNCYSEYVLKTSWRRLEDMSWRRLEDLSWRRLEYMSWRRPEDMSWKHLQDVLKTKKIGISVYISQIYIWQIQGESKIIN